MLKDSWLNICLDEGQLSDDVICISCVTIVFPMPSTVPLIEHAVYNLDVRTVSFLYSLLFNFNYFIFQNQMQNLNIDSL